MTREVVVTKWWHLPFVFVWECFRYPNQESHVVMKKEA